MTQLSHGLEASQAACFEGVVSRILPRILTQISRDPGAPTYGSCDRNWWHYKIRDFSSIILQQGAYALAEAAGLPGYRDHAAAFRALARAGALFWNERAGRRGAFEEYYPWEQGYPPLAFSTLAMAKLVTMGVVARSEVRNGLQIAAGQLLARFEGQAGNQQVAGLAALGVLRSIDAALVPADEFERLAERTLALQSKEGWFEEYDGPDLGYLAVTIDCLWDLFDASGEARFLSSAERALRFLDQVVSRVGGSVGMLNARNTDYIVPYGIARMERDGGPEIAAMAGRLLDLLYADVDSPGHFVAAIDDRYLSHYVGHSFIRAAAIPRKVRGAGEGLARPGGALTLPECAYHFEEVEGGTLLVAGRKGGVFHWRSEGFRMADYGWVVVDRTGEQSFNHWWSRDWTWTVEGGSMVVAGHLFSHQGAVSSPLKHAGLRVLSFVFGSAIISWLKGKLIFKSGGGGIAFTRRITWGNGGLRVVDGFSGHERSTVFARAPRSSKRHVSSADSFHREDLALLDGVRLEEERSEHAGVLQITTTYRVGC